MVYAYVLLWLGCGVLGAGMYFAFVQREFPEIAEKDYWSDWLVSYVIGVPVGPIAVLSAAITIKLFSGAKARYEWRIR